MTSRSRRGGADEAWASERSDCGEVVALAVRRQCYALLPRYFRPLRESRLLVMVTKLQQIRKPPSSPTERSEQTIPAIHTC